MFLVVFLGEKDMCKKFVLNIFKKIGEQKMSNDNKMLSLGDFIKESLVQISNGITEAQRELGDKDAIINPEKLVCNSDNTEYVEMLKFGYTVKDNIFTDKDGNKVDQYYAKRIGFIVDFDISVTTSTKGNTSGQASIVVGTVGLGGKHIQSKEDASYSRVKFRVPLFLPQYKQ